MKKMLYSGPMVYFLNPHGNDGVFMKKLIALLTIFGAPVHAMEVEVEKPVQPPVIRKSPAPTRFFLGNKEFAFDLRNTGEWARIDLDDICQVEKTTTAAWDYEASFKNDPGRKLRVKKDDQGTTCWLRISDDVMDWHTEIPVDARYYESLEQWGENSND